MTVDFSNSDNLKSRDASASKKGFLTSQNVTSPCWRLYRLVFKKLLLCCDEDSNDVVMSGPEWDDSLMTIRHWDVLVAFQLLHSGQLHSANHRYSTQPPQPVSLFATCHLHFSEEEKTDLWKLFFHYVNFTLCHVPLSCLLFNIYFSDNSISRSWLDVIKGILEDYNAK